MNRIPLYKGAGTFIMVLAIILTLACGEKPGSTPPQPATQAGDTFTFFEVGRTTILNNHLRRELKGVLGDVAIESRNIIDLDVNYRGFLQEHFPDIDAVNRQLNSPIGERVDHNTVKLMYRYARKKNVPFDYIEFVFSEYSKTPVLINIRFKVDEADTLANLKNKYGPPNTITWDQSRAKALYWRKDGDLLMVSLIPDQIGTPRYRISIYYTTNLKNLVAAEQKEDQREQQPRKESGKSAF
jgi:hypothetical protein